jgi:hypothetical protein
MLFLNGGKEMADGGHVTEKVKVRFEGLHGHLKTYWAAFSELRAYLLPGWLPYWEKAETGEEQLAMLSPELTDRYKALITPEETTLN